jgi:ubiquinol-cytochrome c reductase cytochrome c1 subunit
MHMADELKIEFLYWEDCPSHPQAWSLLQQVLAELGTEATVEQMATDVAAFLTWTAEPSLVDRMKLGWMVMGFLLFITILAWLAKKQVWANAKRKD